MKRRTFVKVLPVLPVLPSAFFARDGKAQDGKVSGKPSSGASGTREIPAYAKDLRSSDMEGLGPDGRPLPGYKTTGKGH